MFNFSKYQKIVLLVLSSVLLAGLGFSYHRTRAATPSVKAVHLETLDLSTIDGIIQKHSMLNINTANADDLERLRGIGPVLAKRIVEYRQARGPFDNKEDLLKVSGIGPKIYKEIEENICIE